MGFREQKIIPFREVDYLILIFLVKCLFFIQIVFKIIISR